MLRESMVLPLLLLCSLVIALLIAEGFGVKTTVSLSFKGDVKRETAFLAQYGQGVAATIISLLIWSIEPARWQQPVLILLAVAMTFAISTLMKRLSGRMRPNRERAGKFTGPFWGHDNSRESFPSSHSASAIALSVAVVHLYPRTALVLWTLALITAVLRWVMSAHYPSDIVAGLIVGYCTASAVMRLVGPAIQL